MGPVVSRFAADIKTPVFVFGEEHDELNPEWICKEGEALSDCRTYICPMAAI